MGELGDKRLLRGRRPCCTGRGLERASPALTHHGEGPDAGLHRALVLLLQPRALQQPRGRLQQLHHDRLVCLREAIPAAARPALRPGQPPARGPEPTEKGHGQRDGTAPAATACSVQLGKAPSAAGLILPEGHGGP